MGKFPRAGATISRLFMESRIRNNKAQLGMVEHVCNPSTWEIQAEGF
jgi:hypothetical protein